MGKLIQLDDYRESNAYICFKCARRFYSEPAEGCRNALCTTCLDAPMSSDEAHRIFGVPELPEWLAEELNLSKEPQL